jgi:hypothetical protein
MQTSELTGAALDWAVTLALEEYRPVAVPHYSTDWALGGPIIEREKIDLQWDMNRWNAAIGPMRWYIGGPTPLIAAMRCYVTSKLGADVDVPEELT